MKGLAISGYILWILIALVLQHLANWSVRLDFEGSIGLAILCEIVSLGIILIATLSTHEDDLNN